MQQLILALLLFASQVSGYSLPTSIEEVVKNPPVVSIASQQQQQQQGIGEGREFEAVTATEDGHVWLASRWSASNPIDRCILAHELTHWLQQRQGMLKVGWSCEAIERPAYKVTEACFRWEGLAVNQIKWARQQVRKPPCWHAH